MAKASETSGQKPYFLLVLGPHRCGTSALAGVINQLGADLPTTLMAATNENAVGYFESVKIMKFNDKFLNALGAGWKDLAPIDMDSISDQVLESFLSDAVALLKEEFAGAKLPMLKDPRICRLVGFWSKALARAGYRPLYIHTHRNPLEMANSLNKRDGIPVETALLIWLRHVLDAEKSTRGRSRAFTNYRALLDDWRAQVALIETSLGFRFHRNSPRTKQAIDDFLTGSLRHQEHDTDDVRKSSQVAELVRDTFEIFERWTGGKGSERDFARLDLLRTQLDSALDAVATFVRAQEKEQARTKERDAENKALIAVLERERQALEDRESDRAAKLAMMEGELRQRGLEAEQWHSEVGRQAELIEAAHRERDQKQAELLQLTNRLEAREAAARAEMDSQAAELEKLQTKVQELEGALGDRFKEIASVTEMLLSAQKQQAADAKARAANEKRVKELLSSTSWKITGPLRRMVMLVRR